MSGQEQVSDYRPPRPSTPPLPPPVNEARLKKRVRELERRLEQVETRLQRVLETNELWDGS